MADVAAAGTLAALDNSGALAVSLLTGRERTVGVELVVPVSFVGTVLLEGTINNAVWFGATCTDTANVTATNSLTAAGRRLVAVSGLMALRARCSAYTSGSCVVTLAGTP